MRLPLAFFLFALGATALFGAEKFDWPGNGALTFEVPAGWQLVADQSDTVHFNFHATPVSGAAANIQISFINTPPNQPLNEQEIQFHLKNGTAHYLAGSVEQAYTPHPLRVAQGYGWYAEFTDAALVGKPPIRDDLKVMQTAMAALDDHAVMLATLSFDDPKAKELDQMHSLLAGVRFTRAAGNASAADTLRPHDGRYELTVPESHVVLRVPADDFRPTAARAAAAANNPRYFLLADSHGLTFSAWFEPRERFKTTRALWESDAKAMMDHGQPAPARVVFGREGDWETVSYEVAVDGHVMPQLRAELVQADTWIDLHLSFASTEPVEAQRAALVSLLKSLTVAGK